MFGSRHGVSSEKNSAIDMFKPLQNFSNVDMVGWLSFRYIVLIEEYGTPDSLASLYKVHSLSSSKLCNLQSILFIMAPFPNLCMNILLVL